MGIGNDTNQHNRVLETPRKIKRAFDDNDLTSVVKYVKNHQPTVVSEDRKLYILVLQAKLRNENYNKLLMVSQG